MTLVYWLVRPSHWVVADRSCAHRRQRWPLGKQNGTGAHLSRFPPCPVFPPSPFSACRSRFPTRSCDLWLSSHTFLPPMGHRLTPIQFVTVRSQSASIGVSPADQVFCHRCLSVPSRWQLSFACEIGATQGDAARYLIYGRQKGLAGAQCRPTGKWINPLKGPCS